MFLMPRRLIVVVALSLASTLVLVADQDPPAPQATFKAGVDLVDVEVSVLDRYRLPVRDLKAEDFTVLEEGQARPIAAFTPVDLPAREHPSAKWMDDIVEDVQANDFAREGRLIVILMDQSIDPADGYEARRIAEAAIGQMRPGDLAAIAWTVYGVPQNFTSDRRRLIDAVRQPSLNLPSGDTAQSAACYCGACGLQLMADVAEAVQDVRQRRKVLLFVGHRLPQGMGGCGSVVSDAQKRVLRAADVGNLTIHVIDPKGVMTLATTASASTASAPQETAASNLRRVANLTTYTAHTGGRFVTQNMASDVLPEVFRESGSYYVLGFQPSYAKNDGRFRRIAVKVNRPDVTIQSRGGYYAPGRNPGAPRKIPKGLPAPLVDALAGLWPKTDVRVSLGATPVAVPGVRGGAVAVLMNVEQDLSPSGPLGNLDAAFFARPHSTKVSVLTGAFDASGRTYGFDQQSMDVMPRVTGDRRFSYEVASRLELKPGHYEIRAAIHDSTLGQTASAYTYVTVPDFAKEAVSLSGVFLQTDPGRRALGAKLSDITTAAPTTRRTFRRDERVTAFVDSYQGQGRETRPSYVITEIYNDIDQRVYQQEVRVVPASPEQRTATFSVDLPLDQLSPGQYLLSMQVKQGNENARRDVRFEVR
jgi:VWFA-related protein